jgi:hypothetical protein
VLTDDNRREIIEMVIKKLKSSEYWLLERRWSQPMSYME